MNIAYYQQWVDELKLNNITFKSLTTFEDIIKLSFKETQLSIYIVLNPKESVIFYAEEQFFYPDDISPEFSLNPHYKQFNHHLNHCILKDCQLINNDKIIELTFTKWNIYNQEEIIFLIIELIPRYQNIILANGDSKTILDCHKKISFAENHTRQILPGSEYIPPQTNYKHTFDQQNTLPADINSYFADYFINTLFKKKKDDLKKTLFKAIERDIQKATTKLEKQKQEMQSANELEYWSQCVELLKSSFHLLKTGQTSISLTNYYKEGFPDIKISLNPRLHPQKNIEYYAKKYRKALNGQKIISENIAKTEREIASNIALIDEIENIDDYLELKSYTAHSAGAGHHLYAPLVQAAGGRGGAKKLFRTLPISTDWEILIGRSSKENDLLTCKTAKPNDWWFHCRIFQGTHIVLRNFNKKEPPEHLIILCCRLAAYYSSAKNSTNVPVDYTQIRYVRKPKGSPAGYVTYKNQKTYYADPISIREARGMVINY